MQSVARQANAAGSTLRGPRRTSRVWCFGGGRGAIHSYAVRDGEQHRRPSLSAGRTAVSFCEHEYARGTGVDAGESPVLLMAYRATARRVDTESELQIRTRDRSLTVRAGGRSGTDFRPEIAHQVVATLFFPLRQNLCRSRRSRIKRATQAQPLRCAVDVMIPYASLSLTPEGSNWSPICRSSSAHRRERRHERGTQIPTNHSRKISSENGRQHYKSCWMSSWSPSPGIRDCRAVLDNLSG